jgi:DNA-binding NarL/FixJ family response regulator
MTDGLMAAPTRPGTTPTPSVRIPLADPERIRETRPIRVALVDDHEMVREGLQLLLGTRKDLLVVGETSTAEGAFDLIATVRPDVLLVDVTLGDADGIRLVRDIRIRRQDLPVVVLTMHRDAETVRQALLAGAAGYVVKGATSDVLVDAIRAVARGEHYLHSAVAATIINDSIHWLRSASQLSTREREILSLLAGGMSARSIGTALGISVHTVHRHLANLSSKLAVHGRAGLVRYAVENGFIRG